MLNICKENLKINRSESFYIGRIFWEYIIWLSGGYLIVFASCVRMQNASYIITAIAALVLLLSGAAWWNSFHQPAPQPIAGHLQQDTRRAQAAAITTMAAFGFSVMAAILAITGWLR